jgi:hypothetical protein
MNNIDNLCKGLYVAVVVAAKHKESNMDNVKFAMEQLDKAGVSFRTQNKIIMAAETPTNWDRYMDDVLNDIFISNCLESYHSLFPKEVNI